jgi:ligand-binding sensor domain-containing protein/class 3 adenylate cyclase
MRVLSILVALALACGLNAQRYYFENVSVASGLQASKVYAVLQDSAGLVWLGTESGLASYDGITVSNFGPNEGLAMGGVNRLFLDRDKRLWVGHLGGGISLREGRKFRALTVSDTPITVDVTAIAQDASGAMWIGTYGMGALKVKNLPQEGPIEVERFTGATGPGERITSIVRRANGDLVFLDDIEGLRSYETTKGTFGMFPIDTLAEQQGVTCYFEDRSGGIWIGTRLHGALYWKDGKTISYDQPDGLPESSIKAFGEDQEGRVWISAWGGGLTRVDKDGLHLFNKSNGLHSKNIRALARDREGNLLIATQDEGLDIYKGDRFLSFGMDDGLIERHVWAVTEALDHRIWLGTNGGITVLDPAASGALGVENKTVENWGLTSNSIRCFLVDGRGTLWIGTEDGGLLELPVGAAKPIPLISEISVHLGDNKVTALARDGKDGLYVGTIGALIHYLPGGVPEVLRATDGLAGNDVTALFRDAAGNTWIGTAGSGVSMIKPETKAKATKVDLGRIITPTCFTQDAAGRIWVGTLSQGILVLDKGKVALTYDMTAGLLSNNIRSLITDANGHVWIGTNKGLNERKKDGSTFLSFTGRSGFTGIEASVAAVCRTHSGDLWFGTSNGADHVVIDHGEERAEAPLIAVRVLKVNLEERDAIDGVDLSHTERDVRIEYGCVSLSDQSAVRYQYMLEGLEKDWQPVTDQTDAHYAGLPPGAYVFKVKARNRSGLWSDPPILYHFTVLPPWYRSWWFYSAVVLAGAIVLFSYIKVRERQLRTRNLELEEKVELRTAEVVQQSKEIEGQKERIEGLLLNILPKVISDELNEKGKATARMHPEVTVMFTDMKGFTRVAEKMTPEELVRELDECFIQIDRIIGRYGVEKIKTIGDSYMCASGIPQSDPWHAHKMLLAALEVREMMARWCRQREALGKEPWVLRIGIHTGPVVAGVVGQRKFAYDIWGDTVNTASRMESSGATGEVNISGRTYDLIKDDFVCEYRGKVEAKNKGQIDMYFVRRLDPELSADANGVWADPSYLRSLGLTQLIEELA